MTGWQQTLGPAIAARLQAGEHPRILAALLRDLGHGDVAVDDVRQLAPVQPVQPAQPVPAVPQVAPSMCAAHGDVIRAMAFDGHSAAQIAARLTALARRQVSRNAVMGWCWRQKVALRGAPAVAATRLVRPRAPKVAGCSARRARPAAAALPPVATIETVRHGGCRFLAGDSAEEAGWQTPMCGHPARPGTSWCEAHAAVVFSRRAP